MKFMPRYFYHSKHERFILRILAAESPNICGSFSEHLKWERGLFEMQVGGEPTAMEAYSDSNQASNVFLKLLRGCRCC